MRIARRIPKATNTHSGRVVLTAFPLQLWLHEGAPMLAVQYSTVQYMVCLVSLYRVIHKSLRDFRNRLRNNQDRHGRKEHINR